MRFYSRWISGLFRRVGLLKRLISKLAFLANVIPSTQINESNPQTQNYDLQRRIVELSKLLRVEKVIDPSTKFARFGNQFDGGYVVVQDFTSTDALISLGVGHDVTFDAELSKLISKIHLYDHTVNDLPQPVDNATFFKEEIGYVKKESVTLEEALLRLNHSASVILKMDIEGSEWEVLANTVSLEAFKQIVIEFHGLQR